MDKKSKFNIVKLSLFSIFVIILLYFGICNMITGFDMKYANSIKNMNILLSKHPLLPFTRIINSLLPLQYLDQVNFSSFLKVVIYFFNGLFIIEWLYMILLVYVAYQALFCYKRENLIYFIIAILSSTFIFVEFIISLVYAFRLFYYVNINPYQVLGTIGIIYIVIGILIVLVSLVGVITSIIKFKNKNVNKE